MDGYVCIMQCILPSHHQCRKVYFNFWTKPYKPSPGPLSLFSAFLFRYGIAVLLQIPIMRVITSSLRTLVYVRVWCDIIIYIGIISFLCRFHMFLACHTIDSFFGLNKIGCWPFSRKKIHKCCATGLKGFWRTTGLKVDVKTIIEDLKVYILEFHVTRIETTMGKFCRMMKPGHIKYAPKSVVHPIPLSG